MQHIKEEHHKISIKTAKKLFEELWDKNEQLNDPDFTEINAREYGRNHDETPHYENAEKVSQKYAKNARTMATNDITSHKYADIANTIPDAISAISLGKYPSMDNKCLPKTLWA